MIKVRDISIYFKHDTEDSGIIINDEDSRRASSKSYTGTTRCFFQRGDDVILESVAYCSESDKFNKSVGRKVSLTKALKQFSDKDFRKEVWKSYFDTVRS